VRVKVKEYYGGSKSEFGQSIWEETQNKEKQKDGESFPLQGSPIQGVRCQEIVNKQGRIKDMKRKRKQQEQEQQQEQHRGDLGSSCLSLLLIPPSQGHRKDKGCERRTPSIP